MVRLASIAAFASVLVISSPPAPSTLVVSITDAAADAPIAGAEVTLRSAVRTIRTTKSGEARFAGVATGQHHVQVRAIGYASSAIDVDVTGDSTLVRLRLEVAKSVLDTIRVAERKRARSELRLAEFESRRAAGLGRYLTDSALRDDRSQSMQWVLATRFPGIQTRDRGITSTTPSGFAGDMWCPVLIYIDGQQVSDVSRVKEQLGPESQRLAPAANPKGTLVPQPEVPHRQLYPLDNLRPDSLAGVEMYSRTQAPVQYRPLGTYCKVVLLWTRR